MITRRTLTILAAVTAVLFVANGFIGESNDVLWILDDVLFFGFLACALALVVLTIVVLARAMFRTRTTPSSE